MPLPISLLFCLLVFTTTLFAEDDFEEQMRRYRTSVFEHATAYNETKAQLPISSKVIRLTIAEAIEQVIENNIIVQNAKLEILKADSPELKNTSKFTWKLLAGVQSFKQILPNNRNNLFGGTKRSQDKISTGIEKTFKSGTYFKGEVYTLRFDTNAFEDPYNPFTAGFSTLAAPPMYTGAVSVTLSQELIKYGFGETEANTEKILKNKTMVVKDNYVNILTQLVVKILVDYWSLNILDSQISTYEKLLKNAEEIRTITIRKRSLGLSEAFEVNQWNQAIYKTESELQRVRMERFDAERNLMRVLGVDPGSSIAGVTDLSETLPAKFDLTADKRYALDHRIDFLLLKRQKTIAELLLQNAHAEDLPSLKASVSYSSLSQNFLSPQENLLMRDRGITSFVFPQISAEIDLSYPLWDKGIKAGIQEAELNQKSTDIEIDQLKQSIEQEIETRSEAVLTSHQVLEDFKKNQKELEKYYAGLLERFKQGRFSAANVKRALDALAQSELAVTQARINFNINLVRYDLAKNSLFAKYGIDLYGILAELEKRANEAMP